MKVKNQIVIFFILLFADLVRLQFEEYEPSDEVCEKKCVCQYQNDSLLLNCANRSFHHVLANWPKHSTHLTASFSWNNITVLQQLPASNATTISLTLSHCGISKLKTALFIDCIEIRYLDLSWNNLIAQELTPEVFRGRYNNIEYEPIELQQLDLSHNNIESLDYQLFEHTPRLKILNLNDNPFKVIDLHTSHAISSVLSLTTLKMSNTSIETMPNDMLSRLQKLRDVDLSRNKFKSIPMALSGIGNNLEILKIGDNPIEQLDDESFMGLHALRELNISNMQELQSILPNTFSKLYKLRILYCANNPKLDNIHHKAFGEKSHMPPLQEIYLQNNNLETLYEFQFDWFNLTIVDLSGNRWLCDCQLLQTLYKIYKDGIIMPRAMCTQPNEIRFVYLDELEKITEECNLAMERQLLLRIKPKVVESFLMKTSLIIFGVMLTLVACYVFWKVLIKYNNIRAVNTMYPVMYSSAPTTEKW